MPVRFGPRRGLLLHHPDTIEEVLVTRNRDFIKSPVVRLLSRLLGNGLLLSEAGIWLRQRRLPQPAFHRQRVAAYGEVMPCLTGSPAYCRALHTSSSAADRASASATRSP